MKKYFVLYTGKSSDRLEKALLLAHVDHIKGLHAQGRLVIGGPLDDDRRALLIITGNSREEVEQIIRSDPFIRQEYYGSYEIHLVIEGNEDNNWLLDS